MGTYNITEQVNQLGLPVGMHATHTGHQDVSCDGP
jgi:hypothetical protein